MVDGLEDLLSLDLSEVRIPLLIVLVVDAAVTLNQAGVAHVLVLREVVLLREVLGLNVKGQHVRF